MSLTEQEPMTKQEPLTDNEKTIIKYLGNYNSTGGVATRWIAKTLHSDNYRARRLLRGLFRKVMVKPVLSTAGRAYWWKLTAAGLAEYKQLITEQLSEDVVHVSGVMIVGQLYTVDQIYKRFIETGQRTLPYDRIRKALHKLEHDLLVEIMPNWFDDVHKYRKVAK